MALEGKPVPDNRLDIYREKLRHKVGEELLKIHQAEANLGPEAEPFLLRFSVTLLPPSLSSAAA